MNNFQETSDQKIKKDRTKRKILKSTQIEKNIMQASLEIIAKNGIAQFDLASLSRKLDLSSSHLLYHIGSLNDLITKLAQNMFLELNEKIKIQTAAAMTNSDRLFLYLKSIHNHLMFNSNQHVLYRQILALSEHHVEIKTMLRKSNTSCIDYLTILLNDSKQARKYQALIVGLLVQNQISEQEFLDYFNF